MSDGIGLPLQIAKDSSCVMAANPYPAPPSLLIPNYCHHQLKFLQLPSPQHRITGMRFGALLFAAANLAFAEDAAAIMAKVAANVEGAVEGRKQYVYQQTVRASLVRTNGQLARSIRLFHSPRVPRRS
jgi:hypothetical protein